jgi:hypothetical protein
MDEASSFCGEAFFIFIVHKRIITFHGTAEFFHEREKRKA